MTERTELIAMRPSGLARVIACPASRRMEGRMPPKESSRYADEGSAAHALAEKALSERRGPFEWRSQVISVHGNPIQITDEMIAAVCTYVAAVQRDRADRPGAKIKLEHQLYLAEINNTGTVDCLVLDDGYIGVRDYKHGRGVYVTEVWNSQMLAYALAAWNTYAPGSPDQVTVEMTIHQPRFAGSAPARPFRISATQLLRWRDETLLPAIAASEDPDAEATAGEHCRFCAAKSACMAHLLAPKPERQRIGASPVAPVEGFDF